MTKHRVLKTSIFLGILILATAAATPLPAQDFDDFPWGKPPAALKAAMPPADWQEVHPDDLAYENLPCTTLLKVERELGESPRPGSNEDHFIFYDEKLIAVIYERQIKFEKQLLRRDEFREKLLERMRDKLAEDSPLQIDLRGYGSQGDPMEYASFGLRVTHSELVKAARLDRTQALQQKAEEYLPEVIDQLELSLPMTNAPTGD